MIRHHLIGPAEDLQGEYGPSPKSPNDVYRVYRVAIKIPTDLSGLSRNPFPSGSFPPPPSRRVAKHGRCKQQRARALRFLALASLGWERWAVVVLYRARRDARIEFPRFSFNFRT